MQVKTAQSQLSIKDIISKEHELSEERIKIMLTAGILRYFEGRTTLKFVTSLADGFIQKRDLALRGDVLEAITLLNTLGYQVQFMHIAPDLINKRLDTVLEKLHPQKILH